MHGHDLRVVAFVRSENHKFVSAAEEKVIRVFEAPKIFIRNIETIAGITTKESKEVRPQFFLFVSKNRAPSFCSATSIPARINRVLEHRS